MGLAMHKDCLTGDGLNTLNALSGTLHNLDAVLAGGTALALQIGHRKSVDLDYFSQKEFRQDSILSGVEEIGLPFQVVKEEMGTLIFSLGGMMISIFHYKYPFLDTQLFHGTKVASISDIGAMKLIAIIQRGARRDFIDLYFMLKEIPFHIIAEHAVKKFGAERINPLHAGKSLVYFTDAGGDPDPEYLPGHETDWEDVKAFFKNHVKQFVLDLEVAAR
jgi:predicted nucleotidyltransferase component of viral defense system